MTDPTTPDPSTRARDLPSLKGSPIVKMLFVAFLLLLLLIPLSMITSVAKERRGRYDAVVNEVGRSWGLRQALVGPVLSVPYLVEWLDQDDRLHRSKKTAHFLPADLAVAGRVDPEIRNRGIFDVAVYRVDLGLSGRFSKPDFETWGIADELVLWNEATLSMGIPDLRGIREAVALEWGGEPLPFLPGAGPSELFTSGIKARLVYLAATVADEEAELSFAFDLSLNGSGGLSFAPVGEETTIDLASSWLAPSFSGAFLPAEREVGEEGFSAQWKVFHFGRGYPQSWRSADGEAAGYCRQVERSLFGVELLIPVDTYRQNLRSVKYGVLFLLLTFLSFFLFEVFHPIAVHPFQYLLVGFALCLFYLLLLSLSEHIGFALSYLIAAASTIGMIAAYSRTALKGGRRAAATGGVLAFLYGYLYVLLRAEDYALVLGAVGLFVILAMVMYVTRGVDWYGLSLRPSGPSGATQ